jgi:hypothetical protein
MKKDSKNDRMYRKCRADLIQILNVIWMVTKDETWEELSKSSGVGVRTLTKLYYGGFVYPQFFTIQKLAVAVGYNLTLTEDGVKVQLNANYYKRLKQKKAA